MPSSSSSTTTTTTPAAKPTKTPSANKEKGGEKKEKAPKASVATPVPVPTPSPTPTVPSSDVEAVASKAPRKPRKAKEATTDSVEAQASVVTPKVEEPLASSAEEVAVGGGDAAAKAAVEVSGDAVNDHLAKITGIIGVMSQQLSAQIRAVRTDLKYVKTEYSRLKRKSDSMNDKINKRKKMKSANSGVKCKKILSDEMADLLNKPPGTAMSRCELVKSLHEDYIKPNNLQMASDKRNIIPDERLTKLLTIPEGYKLTSFTIQRFLNRHFLDKVETPSAVAGVTEGEVVAAM